MSVLGAWWDVEDGLGEKEDLRWMPEFPTGDPVDEEPLLGQG